MRTLRDYDCIQFFHAAYKVHEIDGKRRGELSSEMTSRGKYAPRLRSK